ncbi:LysR family transcriptional regulator [Cupriavidus taiwanensis]|uniref:LysR family transcriptional regulator n=1 Tax=Cupriavidus taiwanensis TaxID=164546 RepID=UPI00253FC0ED|nr:LysR family transcriptional regulator [Cupriavidus taiwanensis]MDK3025115.1 LysR family transcriptional regulator [Cupriavidus taiwanensis]
MEPSFDSIAWARRLRVRHLESFLILIDAGTLSAAAKRLHMTQSAVSHWLSEMEELAGVRLAVRGRRVQLTPAGEAVRRLAVRVLGEISRAHDELGSIARGAVARLHVGSVVAGVAHLIPRAIVAFQAANANVSIQVTEGAFNTLLDRLEKREFDLIVGSIDTRAFGPHLAHEVLFEDGMAVVVGTHHALAHARSVQWAELFPFPWVMPQRETLMRTRLDTVLLEHGGAGLRPRVETGSVVTLEAVLRDTDYVGVCSEAMALHMQSLGLLHVVPVAEKESFGPVGAVWRKGGDDEVLHAFVDALRLQAGPMRSPARIHA